MPAHTLRIDAASLSLVGALGAATCGPSPPATSGAEETSDATLGETSGGPTTLTSTSAPPTTDPTTGSPPECRLNSDCDVCNYCLDGLCEYDPGCYCGVLPTRPGTRCSQPYYECYGPEDCGPDQNCIDHACVPLTIPLPACPPDSVNQAVLELTAAPTDLDLADLDGDLDLDLALGLPTADVVVVALGTGAGEFIPGAPFDLDKHVDELTLAAGDIDADGDADLLVGSTEQGGLHVLVNDGAGAFTNPFIADAFMATSRILTGRVNADENDDVVTISHETLAPTLRLGDSVDLLQLDVTFDFPAFLGASLLDVDADGRADLVTAPPPGGTDVVVAFAVADEFGPPNFLAGEPAISHAHAGDLNNDGALDIVATVDLGDHGGVLVWTAVGPGQWGASQRFSSGARLLGGVVADFNGDGAPDLVSATGDDSVAVLLGDGAGGFACEQGYPGPGAATEPALLAVGRVDGDDRLDIVVGSRETPAVRTLLPL